MPPPSPGNAPPRAGGVSPRAGGGIAAPRPAAIGGPDSGLAGRLRIARAPIAAPALPAGRPALIFLAGEPATPGHLYRVARPAAAAEAAGLPALVLTAEGARGHLAAISAAAVLWVWRAQWSGAVAEAINAARQGGARVVFDVDDLMVDPRHATPAIIDGMRTQKRSGEDVAAYFERIRATLLHADLCITSTEELAAHIRAAGSPCLVIPNGFDHDTTRAAREAIRHRPQDGLLRLGYAGGSRTHQRDFAVCADAIAQALRRHPQARLVIFESPQFGPLLDVGEYAALRGLDRQVERRPHCPLAELPAELARFDINLAPLEVGNPFCEAKSELKFFEAALVDVPTIASPTGPFRRAIRHDETGLLASSPAEWSTDIQRLIGDPRLRHRLGEAAHRAVLWAHGPERRAQLVAEVVDALAGERAAARIFALSAGRAHQLPPQLIPLAGSEVAFASDRHARAELTVTIPLHNYAGFVLEALDSAAGQTLADLDLVVVDDCSHDSSLAVAVTWARAHAERFGVVLVLRHHANAGLAAARNSGFARAATPWVLPLDADNRLLPRCAEVCLQAAKAGDAAFAYPTLRRFGEEGGLLSDRPYDPQRLVSGNYIDALALVSRAAWVAAGGYRALAGASGWEDYDLWCRLAELGLHGAHVEGEPLAEYRVHAASMSRTTDLTALRDGIARAHPWLRLA